MKGIYCYIDKQNYSIVYIGKDSHINTNKRHREHIAPCAYQSQQINKVIQNNPNRYEYKIILKGITTDKILNAFEMAFIRKYEPKFNFTKGGEGLSGFKHSKKTIEKLKKNAGRPKGKYSKTDIHNYKNYFRVLKLGSPNRTQRYQIVKDKKIYKTSTNPLFLTKWFKKNFPNDILENNYISLGWVEKPKEYELRPKGFINNKKRYCIRYDGKVLKQSVYPKKLIKWFYSNFPDKKLNTDILKKIKNT